MLKLIAIDENGSGHTKEVEITKDLLEAIVGTSGGMPVYTYGERFALRAIERAGGSCVVLSLGLFAWTNRESIDDGETFLATPNGGWEIQAIGPDLIEPRREPFVLTAKNTLVSIASLATASFTVPSLLLSGNEKAYVIPPPMAPPVEFGAAVKPGSVTVYVRNRETSTYTVQWAELSIAVLRA